jgi:nucleoporin NDC1
MRVIKKLVCFCMQPYAWCSRIVASLTARSRKEDKFGVARLSGSNADVVSTLISCLLAVENFMGKKTNLQPPNQLGSTRIKFVTANSRRFACIKWATANSRRFDIATFVERKNRAVNSKAYAIADVLKTSIYQIVSAFQDEMLSGTKSSRLEKDWITCKKPPFGTREMLIQKLRLFYDFQAT